MHHPVVSLFANVRDEHVGEEPFFHLHAPNALDPAYYRALAEHFPDDPRIWRSHWDCNNQLMTLSALKARAAGLLAPIWSEFIDYHYSQAFFHDVLSVVGDRIRQAYPDLEAKLGKPLESLAVAARGSGLDTDVFLDVQFGINTPVREPSRVRGFHIDNPKKIYNALLYMRTDEDDSIGGELQLGRFRGRPRLLDVAVPDDAAEVVALVPYRANTMVFMINSLSALHGVSPRMPTPHVRRYVNFLAQLREPLFDLSPYQEETQPAA